MTNIALKDRILNDVKHAMKDKDKDRLTALRMLTAAIKQREVDERIVLDDEQVTLLINKLIKQRKDSVAQYEAGNRLDLAQKEAAEIALLQQYLPEPLSENDLTAIIELAVNDSMCTLFETASSPVYVPAPSE